jgi:hypothetical protein
MNKNNNSEIEMKEFGLSLTGRPYGKDCFERISHKKLSPPYILNFKGAIAMGSTFGEEIIAPLAQIDKNKSVSIRFANNSIIDCVQKIQEDFSIDITFFQK